MKAHNGTHAFQQAHPQRAHRVQQSDLQVLRVDALKKRGKRHHCAVNGVQRKIPYHKRKIQKTKQAAKPTVRIPKTSIAGESSSNRR